MNEQQIILASKSTIRRQILDGAGLNYICRPSSTDENELKNTFLKSNRPLAELPPLLALEKALNAEANSNDLIIGADQIMEMDGKLFDKPSSMDEARARLLDMRGKEHRLIGAVVVVKNKTQEWQFLSTTRLQVRQFSEKFLDTYLELEGDDILHCVGGYKFEGRGAHLFERVDGDFFSILGLSLLPLLAHLRSTGVVLS